MRDGAGMLAILGLLIGTGGSNESVRSPNPICWKEPRVYHPGGREAVQLETLAKSVLRLTHSAPPLPDRRTPSPGGAYAFHYSEQPNVGRPSGSTKITLLVFKEQPYLLKLEADDVWNLTDARWVNEKLIFFRLWLGRLGPAPRSNEGQAIMPGIAQSCAAVAFAFRRAACCCMASWYAR